MSSVAEAAWEATKDPADPLWANVQLDYRQKLQTHADAVEAKGLTGEPSAFEKKVAELVAARSNPSVVAEDEKKVKGKK